MASLTAGVNNTSRMNATKMFKVEPFPKGVKPTDQFQEWMFWLANFEMAIEKAGTVEQRSKAIDLSLHIGEEMRRIIVAKGMLPKEEAVAGDYQFYNNLTEQLDAHFRGLTDESVDVASFNSLKQKENETALEFELRLRQTATRVRETNAAMIRTRYIEGLRDKSLRERAFVDGLSLSDVVKMATRKEAIFAKTPSDFSPWNEDSRSPMAIAAIDQQRGVQGGERRWLPSSGPSRGSDYSENRGPKRYQERVARNRPQSLFAESRDKNERCKRCGVMKHRSEFCPAENAQCFGCKQIGHFKHMCPDSGACQRDQH